MGDANNNGEALSVGRENLTLAVLFLANLVIGLGMLMPAGLINELSDAFQVSIPRTSILIAYGALTVCVGAPVFAILTNKIERHRLLTLAMLFYGAGHFVSIFVSDFDQLLLLRIIATAPAAIVTPQAASAVSLFVRPERRASAIAVIFAGWTTAFAIGFPLVTLVAGRMGWPAAYVGVGIGALLVTVALWLTVPRRLVPPPLPLQAWKQVFTTRAVMFVFAFTIISNVGQFILYPFIAADLKQNFAAGPEMIALFFSLFGASGVAGTILLTRVVGRTGPHVSASIFAFLVALGIFVWYVGHDHFLALAVSMTIWGFAFPPFAASQQARLIGNAPSLSAASMALNSSFLYIGQSIGTFTGAALLSHHPIWWLGLPGASVAVLACILSAYCYRRWRI